MHPAAAARRTEGLFICARAARPRLPRQVLARSPGRCEAKRAAGTERVAASLIYLPRVKQTLAPALNVDCGISQSDRRAAVSIEPPPGAPTDHGVQDPGGLQEATSESGVAVPRVKPGITARPSSSSLRPPPSGNASSLPTQTLVHEFLAAFLVTAKKQNPPRRPSLTQG